MLSVLIVEDGDTDRLLLRHLLQKLGHRVLEAAHGSQAVDIYHAQRPDLVLMDVMMPVMDGLEATRLIKRAAGDELVPIIFLTSLQDAESLSKCLAAGGDDFLSKPYNRIVLAAKIDAFARMRSMHRTLQIQRDEIARHHQRLLAEQEIAKRVYDKVAHAGCLRDLPNVRYSMSPLSVFNGDVALAAIGPGGNLMLLLGDFTGHGLAAAIGAIPLAQTFYTMVAKGCEFRDIIAELNSKLRASLPVDIFCCAVMLELDCRRGALRIWNGGLPDAILYRRDGSVRRLPSRHLPLGIASDEQFDRQVESMAVGPGDEILLWTDGILEARNGDGEMFGEQRLRAAVDAAAAPEAVYGMVAAAVRDFVGAERPSDDLALLAVSIPGFDEFEALLGEAPSDTGTLVDWSLSYVLNPDSLREHNPVPLLFGTLSDVANLRSCGAVLYVVLVELYNNALEHGVLALDSGLKSGPEGFSEYYRVRDQRLRALREGFIRFDLCCRGDNNGGVVSITVSDSGRGFDVQRTVDGTDGYAGRGLALLRQLCRRVEHRDNGRQTTVDVVWQHGRDGMTSSGVDPVA